MVPLLNCVGMGISKINWVYIVGLLYLIIFVFIYIYIYIYIYVYIYINTYIICEDSSTLWFTLAGSFGEFDEFHPGRVVLELKK